MMDVKLLAHRGLWSKPSEKNSLEALEKAIIAGFGVETDVRDHKGEIVISHDMPSNSVSLKEFLEIYKASKSSEFLALNVKADGLAVALMSLLEDYEIRNYFAFDMSIPEELSYRRNKIRVFSRRSEFEPCTNLTRSAEGLWIDCFENPWHSYEEIRENLVSGQDVCLVSPELHGRPYEAEWDDLKRFISEPSHSSFSTEGSMGRLMLCTDFPTQFRKHRRLKNAS